MHNSRYYRNPAIYAANVPNKRFSLSHTRNTYKTTSTTPLTSSQTKELKTASYANPRFVDRSKYVWTANKQPQSSQPTSLQTTAKPTQQAAPSPAPVPIKVVPASKPVKVAPPPVPVKVASIPVKNNPNARELDVLTITALDTPVAVAKDIALNLQEEKVYLIRKVVDVVGVKKAIKLYYDTRVKELNGGILIQNGKRRRTPGGVFLSLLRESNYITKPEMEKVFLEIKKFESQVKVSHYYDAYW